MTYPALQAREALLELPQTCSTLVGVALEGSPDAKERAAKVRGGR
jgi:hypothetical protein